MPRINIDLPEHFPFSTEIQVHASHINGAGHLDNAQLPVMLSEVRKRFFVSLGYTELQIEGLGTVITDTAIQYRSEAFEGETLVFRMLANDFNKYGCDLVCRVLDRDSGREVARGKIGFVFFDYATRKIAPVPARFMEQLAAAGGAT